ncbi:MAG TPA: tRNA lysidine(34) synthetase TilS [Candidatus Acidoferrales bacterium]|nr:tRNA lysidine(34) synthetase TilS [Candidatus Acidoferrales bacterium]
MKTPIQRIVRDTIQHHRMLHLGNRLGLAVSGGADSVALLRLFEELRRELGVTLCVLHFNHQFRGTESDADEAFVKSLAGVRGLECLTETASVATIAKQRGWSLEDAARRLRYEFFDTVISRGFADCVATAHTADDQAETVLARMIRGTGLAGLSSIQPVRGKIIRPLIGIRRGDLRSFLAERGQDWREDETNRDTQRLRARVRHRLLPELEQNFSASITDRLCDLASLAQDDERFWSALVEERLHNLVSRSAEGFSVEVNDLLSPSPGLFAQTTTRPEFGRALTQRLIRRLFAEAAQTEGQFTRSHVEQVIFLAKHGTSGRKLQLPGGVTIEREFGRLVFRPSNCASGSGPDHENSGAIASYKYEVMLPDNGSTAISIPELGRSFRLKVIDWPKAQRDTRPEDAVLDAERLVAPLLLRNWNPGDAYRPCGRRQRRKLARMFMAGRIASTQRALWPVLTSAGRLAWADRMPVAEEFSTTDATRTALWIVESFD